MVTVQVPAGSVFNIHYLCAVGIIYLKTEVLPLANGGGHMVTSVEWLAEALAVKLCCISDSGKDAINSPVTQQQQYTKLNTNRPTE